MTYYVGEWGYEEIHSFERFNDARSAAIQQSDAVDDRYVSVWNEYNEVLFIALNGVGFTNDDF